MKMLYLKINSLAFVYRSTTTLQTARLEIFIKIDWKRIFVSFKIEIYKPLEENFCFYVKIEIYKPLGEIHLNASLLYNQGY